MSRKFLDNCLYSVNQIFKQRGRLAYESNHDYQFGIRTMVKELHESGYQLSHISHLKIKHVNFLIKQWQEKGLENATIKNRVSQLRYLSHLIGKPTMIPKENSDLNIGQRSYKNMANKAIYEVDLSKFTDPLIQYSVRLQQLFGLRREEAIKFVVGYADQGDYIQLKASWTKGGIWREVEITDPEQRALLDELRKNVGEDKSLIPDGKTYAYQRNVYDEAVAQAGYKNFHGLRHAYAQRRYFEITDERSGGKGWHAPLNGGKRFKDLTPEERKIDMDAREIISRSLGHSRIEISETYIGE